MNAMLIELIALVAGSYLVKKSRAQHHPSTSTSQTPTTPPASGVLDNSRMLIRNVFSALSSKDRKRQQRLLNQDHQVEIQAVEGRIDRDLMLSAG